VIAAIPRRAWTWGSAVLITLGVVFAGRAVPWAIAAASVRAASIPLLVLAAVATGVAIAARVVGWACLLRVIGVDSAGIAARSSIIAMALNCVLVGNAGEVVRAAIVTRESHARIGAVVAMIALERLVMIVPFILLVVVAGLLMPLPPTLARWYLPALGAVVLLTLGIVVTRSAESERGCAGRPGRVCQALERVHSTARLLLAPGRLAVVLASAGLHWAMQYLAFIAAAAALHFPSSPVEGLIALLVLSVSGSVRVTPGGVGVNQLAMVGVAQALHLPAAEAVGVALVLQAIQTVSLLVAALAIITCRSSAPTRAPTEPPCSQRRQRSRLQHLTIRGTASRHDGSGGTPDRPAQPGASLAGTE